MKLRSEILILIAAALAAVPAAAPVAAQVEDLSAAFQAARTAVTAHAASAHAAPAPSRAAAEGRAVSLRCRSLDGRVEITAVLSADRGTLENSWSGRSPRLDTAKRVVDERCGTTGVALGDALNYEVTPPHVWGQDILQIRLRDADSRAAKFTANLHDCSYDGDWSDSRDVELACESTAP